MPYRLFNFYLLFCCLTLLDEVIETTLNDQQLIHLSYLLLLPCHVSRQCAYGLCSLYQQYDISSCSLTLFTFIQNDNCSIKTFFCLFD